MNKYKRKKSKTKISNFAKNKFNRKLNYIFIYSIEPLIIHFIHHNFEILPGNTSLEGNYPKGNAYNVADLEAEQFCIRSFLSKDDK